LSSVSGLLLESWTVATREIGFDVGRKGLRDEEVVVLLQRLRQPTFFTRDLGFYNPELRHLRYAIVVAAVGQCELTAFVRRFVHHTEAQPQPKPAPAGKPAAAKIGRPTLSPMCQLEHYEDSEL
jgi:hypothetical protein